MTLQEMLREPLIVVTTLFALSLTGAFVLFKFLTSQASVKSKNWRAGGAIAGFLLIFFPSLSAVNDSVDRVRTMQAFDRPTSVPLGSRAIASPDVGGYAVSLPNSCLPVPGMPVIAAFADPTDASGRGLFWIQTQEDLSDPEMGEFDPTKLPKEITFAPGMKLSYVGEATATHFQGMPALRTTVKLEFQLEQRKPETIEGVVMLIHDNANHRKIFVMHSRNELGDRILSTLNLKVGRYRQ